MKERNRDVDSPLELSAVQTLIRVCRWIMLFSADILSCRQRFTESGVCQSLYFTADTPLGLSTVFCFWANLRWFLKLFLI